MNIKTIVAMLQVFALLIFPLAGFGRTAAQQLPSDQRQTTRPGELNTDASRVFTFVEGTGMGHSHGVEAKLSSGSLVLGVSDNAGQLVFDMKTFDADTPLARKVVGLNGTSANWMRKQVTKEIHSNKILHSSEFPTSTFEIASSMPITNGNENETGLPAYELVGRLTLRGETKTVRFPVTVQQTKGWMHVTGRFSFKQSEFGIKPLSKGLGAIGVADKLTVFGDLWIAPTPESLASMQSLQGRR